MKQVKKKMFLSGPVGYSFMLTMLMVVVFVVFGVLSLSASLRDYEYSQRTAKKLTAYYEANTKAYGILAEIDKIFVSEDTLEAVKTSLSKLPEVMVISEREQTDTISYEVKINSRQKLQIQLAITEDAVGRASYKVTEWKEVPSDSWETTTHLPVIGGK